MSLRDKVEEKNPFSWYYWIAVLMLGLVAASVIWFYPVGVIEFTVEQPSGQMVEGNGMATLAQMFFAEIQGCRYPSVNGTVTCDVLWKSVISGG